MTIRKLTAEEIGALQRFAAKHGHYWKTALVTRYWCGGRIWISDPGHIDDGPILQRLRHDPEFGHQGLDKFRLEAA